MAKRIVKYNPAFLDEEDLVRGFVVRHSEFELIMETVRENVGPSNQHLLVVGPRGSGKTTLALRVAAEIRNAEDLKDRWYPLVFGEESYQVFTAGEFWLESLFHLYQQTKDPRWKKTYEELRDERDEGRLRERALGQLMDFADGEGKRIMIVVENLNMLLSDQMNDDDQWALRKTLLHEGRVMLLATATNRFEEVEHYEKAMFELFRMMELKPLDKGECAALWESITGEEIGEKRIRPIEIFTGGNPRLVMIISSFAAGLSFKDLMDDLIKLVDDNTDYFKTQLDNLAPTERKVYLALAELWDPSTAAEVARAARLEVNKTSSLLARLEGRGAVSVFGKKGRTKQYQVAERMYNIYYLMRRRGGPLRRVRALVNIMVVLYEERELLKVTRNIAEEACKIGPEGRLEHYLACEGILNGVSSPQFREEFFKVAPKSFFQMPDIPPFLKQLKQDNEIEPVESAQDQGELKGLLEQIDNLIKDPEKLEKAEEVCRVAMKLSPENAQLWVRFGFIRERAGAYVEAEKAYRKAIKMDPEYAPGWAQLGRCLEKHLERYDEAEKAYRKATQIEPKVGWAWAHLGQLLEEHLERYDEAEKMYRKAVEIDPVYAWAWAQLGWLLAKHLERYDEAEKMYRKAVEIDPVYAWVWAHLGQLLEKHLERYDEAEKMYRKAVEIAPAYVWAWARLGWLLEKHLERYDEAEKAYRNATQIEPKVGWAWAHLGQLLEEHLERYDEAEKMYSKAVEIDPAYVWAWARLGWLLEKHLERYDEAEKMYHKAVEIDPKLGWAWAQLGRILEVHLDRYDEAKTAYRKAIAVEPENLHGLDGLITLLLQREGEPMEALELAEEFVSEHPDNAAALNCFAWAFYKHGKCNMLEHAEAWGRKAVELDCDHAYYQHTLGCILAARGKGEDSLACARKYLGDRDTVEKTLDDAIELFVELAAGGFGVDGLKVLRESGCADLLEPLVVGVALYVGEDVKVAAEIMEVGKDVKERIEERRKKRAGGRER